MRRTCGEVGASGLKRLLEEDLPGPEKGRLESHLETCEVCRDALEELAGEPGWWDDARKFVPRDLEPPPIGPTGGRGPEDDGGPGPRRTESTCPGGEIWLDFLAPSEDTQALGRLAGYEVLGVLGRGGMGIVFKAYDRALDRMVALKGLSPALAASGAARHRFAREARAAAAVVHEHVVAIHGVSTWRGLPYLVMQYVPGRSLQDRIDQDGPLDVEEVLRIGVQAAAGLAAAHAHGLVHRDVKPSNILLEDGLERVKITDFGLARAADDASLTQSGVLAGTPQYMAPEQAQGDGIDHRADLFSLGSVMYAMCAGRPPFRAETTLAVIRRLCDEDPRPLREINPDVPSWLAAIIKKLHAKDPSDRFASATELAEVLAARLAQLRRPDDKPELPVAYAGDRWNTWLPIAAGILMVVVVVGSVNAGGFNQIRAFLGTVFRIKTPDGTLVIDVDDPEVKVRVDGSEVVVSGTGPQEFRYRPGPHRIVAIRDGQPVLEKVVTIERGAKEIVSISQERDPASGPTAGPEPKFRPPITEDGPPRALKPAAPRSLQAIPEVNPHVLQQRIRRLEDQLARMQAAPEAHVGPALPAPRAETGRQPPTAPPVPEAPVPALLPEAPAAPPTPPAPVAAPGAEPTPAAPVAPPGPEEPPAAPIAIPAPEPAPAATPEPDERLLAVHPLNDTSPAVEYANGALRAVACPLGIGDLALVSRDGTLSVWSRDPLGAREKVLDGAGCVNKAAFSPDGKSVAICDATKGNDSGISVKLWDVPDLRGTGNEASPRFAWSVPSPFALTFSPDGRELAVGGQDGLVHLFDVSTGRVHERHSWKKRLIRHLTFTPDSGTVAASSYDNAIQFWNVRPGAADRSPITWLPSVANCLAFSPDGRTLAVATTPATEPPAIAHDNFLYPSVENQRWIRLFPETTKTGDRQPFGSTRDTILSLAFSPDGSLLVSGGGAHDGEGEVKVWDASTGRILADLKGHRRTVACLAFSSDGDTLVTAGGWANGPGEVKLWDLRGVKRREPSARN